MKKQQNFTRREALKLGAGTGISLTLGSLPAMGSIDPWKDNRIILENQKEGTTDWQLTRVRPDKDLYRTSYIEGYCSKQSYKTGEKLDIMVSASPAASYQLTSTGPAIIQVPEEDWCKASVLYLVSHNLLLPPVKRTSMNVHGK
jgi:hypothetical protein